MRYNKGIKLKKTILFRSCLFLIILFYVLSLLGTVISADNYTCTNCGGDGLVCSLCGGAGDHNEGLSPCPVCQGRGYLLPPGTPSLSTASEPATLPSEPIETTMPFYQEHPYWTAFGVGVAAGIVVFGSAVLLGGYFATATTASVAATATAAATATTTSSVSVVATSWITRLIINASSLPYAGPLIANVLSNPWYLKILSRPPAPVQLSVGEKIDAVSKSVEDIASKVEGELSSGPKDSELHHELKHSTHEIDQIHDQTKEITKEYANQNNWTDEKRLEMDKYIEKHANDPNELKKLQKAAKGGGLEHFLRK